MGHHSHGSSKSLQYTHNYRYTVPTSYGPAAGFTVNDLGKQGHFEGQSMQRSDSSLSNTDSYDSALNDTYGTTYMYRDNSQSSISTGYIPTYSSMDYTNSVACYEANDPYNSSPVNTYQLQTAANTGFPGGAYAADWATPRAEASPYQQTIESPVSPMSPGLQQNGIQENQPVKYLCLICTQSFARQADLKRHYDHKHSPAENLDQFYCDYKQCLRSEHGYRLALERMGQSPREKVSGIGPFTRKDHFKAHLREQHQEALPKRDTKNDPRWLSGKIMKAEWWRCVKCLKRVWIQKQRDQMRDEYICCDCGTPCDQEVLNARQKMFNSASASASNSASTLTSSRRHRR